MPALLAPAAPVMVTRTSGIELAPVVDSGGTVRGLLVDRPGPLTAAEQGAVQELASCWRSVLGTPMELHLAGGSRPAVASGPVDGPATICWRGRRGRSQLVRPTVVAGSTRALADRARSPRELVLALDVGAREMRRSRSWRAAGPAFGGPVPVEEWRWWLVGLACADPSAPSLPSSPRPRMSWHRRWPRCGRPDRMLLPS